MKSELRITAIVLGAGEARRFGSPKQLAIIGGKPLIRRAAEVALGAGVDRVIVVLGAYHAQIEPVLQDLPLNLVVNNSWKSGLGSSIRAGVEAAISGDPDGILLFLGDQARVTPDLLRQVISRYAETGCTIACRRVGEISPPVLFGRTTYPQLIHIPDEIGAKALLTRDLSLTTLESPEAFCDIDVPDDLKSIS